MNAKEKIMNRSNIAKTFTIAAVTALALCVAPTAHADDKGCSNATLKGTFVQKRNRSDHRPAVHRRPDGQCRYVNL